MEIVHVALRRYGNGREFYVGECVEYPGLIVHGRSAAECKRAVRRLVPFHKRMMEKHNDSTTLPTVCRVSVVNDDVCEEEKPAGRSWKMENDDTVGSFVQGRVEELRKDMDDRFGSTTADIEEHDAICKDLNRRIKGLSERLERLEDASCVRNTVGGMTETEREMPQACRPALRDHGRDVVGTAKEETWAQHSGKT